jgi:transposase
MTRALSTDLKQRIINWYLNDGMDMEEITDLASVSIGLVSNVVSLYCQYGQVSNPFGHRPGHPSYLNADDILYTETILQANPGLYLDEIQENLAVVCNLHVSVATICRSLLHLDMSHKAITKTASQCDEMLQTLWEAQMAEYTDPNVFVFLDESAVDQATAHRTHGQSTLGTRCVQHMSFICGIRHSILPALTLDGIITLDIFEGSVDKN